ncbi:MAG: TetR/AcrR family transcriptional regulator [Gemmatimonadales bacterium]|nr:TetR/AcrR family transcriptional regulator [Gemmatimonadales bacterium]
MPRKAVDKPRAGSNRSYHHGDLRRTLLDVALRLLEEFDPSHVSLRAIAREAGVSRAAPYHHFADREALLAAVAAEGFRSLRAAMVERVASTEGNPLERMQEMGVAYVLFAVQNPQLYRLMFGGELRRRESHEELQRESGAAYAALGAAMQDSMETGSGGGGEPGNFALSAWALVHGLAMLLVDQRVGKPDMSDQQVEVLARQATEVLGRGVAG